MISKKDNARNWHHLRKLFDTLFLKMTSDVADLPFLALNAAAGALIMYGLVGLRHEAWAIFQMSAIMALQSTGRILFSVGDLHSNCTNWIKSASRDASLRKISYG